MDKELRNELRRNELKDSPPELLEARGFLTQSEVVKPGLAVLGLFLVLGGLYYGQKYRAAVAESAFSRATEVFHAEVDPFASSPSGTRITFKSRTQKLDKAKALFDEVAASYTSMPAGKRARYYSALCLVQLGKTQEAEAALKPIAALRDPVALEPALARLELAELMLRTGRGKDAAAAYQGLIADEASGLPKDRLLFGVARSYEAAGDKGEARRAYTDLVNRYPQSPYAQDSRQKIEALQSL